MTLPVPSNCCRTMSSSPSRRGPWSGQTGRVRTLAPSGHTRTTGHFARTRTSTPYTSQLRRRFIVSTWISRFLQESRFSAKSRSQSTPRRQGSSSRRREPNESSAWRQCGCASSPQSGNSRPRSQAAASARFACCRRNSANLFLMIRPVAISRPPSVVDRSWTLASTRFHSHGSFSGGRSRGMRSRHPHRLASTRK